MQKNLFKKNSQSGISVVEIIIAIFIFSLIGLAAVSFQLDVFSLNRISGDNIVAQEDARRVLKILSKEIRSMSPSSLGAYPILQAGTSSLIFYTNIDNDSLQERVRYFLTDNTLKKGTIKPVGNPLVYDEDNEKITEIVHNVISTTTPIFSYYDTNYDGLSPALIQPVDSLLVRLIKIDLIIDDDPSKLPATLYMTTQVSIRNLKDNL